jgi:hypothetical protein
VTIIFSEPTLLPLMFSSKEELKIKKRHTAILFFDVQILSLVTTPLIPAIMVSV